MSQNTQDLDVKWLVYGRALLSPLEHLSGHIREALCQRQNGTQTARVPKYLKLKTAVVPEYCSRPLSTEPQSAGSGSTR
jgi:hypothetical protein